MGGRAAGPLGCQPPRPGGEKATAGQNPALSNLAHSGCVQARRGRGGLTRTTTCSLRPGGLS